jgi:hypothetical protein
MQTEVLVASIRCLISSRTRNKYKTSNPKELYEAALANHPKRPTKYSYADVRFTPVRENGREKYIVWHALTYSEHVRPPLIHFCSLC